MTDVVTARRSLRPLLLPWERGTVVALSLVLLALALTRLGAALWSAIHTWLARGETQVVLPTRYEVPGSSVPSNAADQGISVVSGGFGTGEFVLGSVDETAHLQLTLARVILAVLLIALLVLVATVVTRVALGRAVVSLLARGSAACGLLLVIGSPIASGFEAAALRAIATDLRDVVGITSVFPEDVRFAVEWAAVCGGLALFILAVVLRGAHRRQQEPRTSNHLA